MLVTCVVCVFVGALTSAHHGIVVRAVSETVNRLKSTYEGVKLRITYLELYNEVRSLLHRSDTRDGSGVPVLIAPRHPVQSAVLMIVDACVCPLVLPSNWRTCCHRRRRLTRRRRFDWWMTRYDVW